MRCNKLHLFIALIDQFWYTLIIFLLEHLSVLLIKQRYKLMLIKINKSVHLTRIYIIIYRTSKRIAFFLTEKSYSIIATDWLLKLGCFMSYQKSFSHLTIFFFFNWRYCCWVIQNRSRCCSEVASGHFHPPRNLLRSKHCSFEFLQIGLFPGKWLSLSGY